MVQQTIPMAIIYDFDGTLAPGNMQEHQFIPDVEMTVEGFWDEVSKLAKKEQADEILTYMRLMVDKAKAHQVRVTSDDFKKHGEQINLFDGVEGWFDRITEYGAANGVTIKHFLISSGNHEIIAGTSIAKKFAEIYASKFFFDQYGAPVWPALAINYTTKTQYLFRINKGADDLSDRDAINRFVEKKDRPVPFENMVYIGDGLTDVPCFRLVKDLGGLSIAVYNPDKPDAKEAAIQFVRDGRVHGIAPTDYANGGRLDGIIKSHIELLRR